VVFLLFITGEVSSTPGYFPLVLKPTTTACKFARDCEEITKPNMAVLYAWVDFVKRSWKWNENQT
jgi:hypothetical protein